MQDFHQTGNQTMASFGQFGIRILTTNAIASEEFVAIQALQDSTISATCVPYVTQKGNVIGDASVTSLALTAGTIIYGRFTALQVASGKVIAYKG